uniref:SNF1-like protein kinase ssp2-like n=1 Tax=Saccoglossus kowalevskii TaxID=10224 RepID=A0ABM0LVT0_SACKO|nr:PREDICTED: SNF1-like protein kinase ssp2-like [Saccoglossus kowalevskii]
MAADCIALTEEDILHTSRRTSAGKTYKKKKVGNYILGETIGSGSFAKVRLGTHILTDEKVAIKVIDKKLIEKREYTKRNLHREAVMLQRLKHPNIVQLYEVLETSNNYYLILELADGGELMKYLCDKQRFTERESRKFMRQLVSAVDHMHQAGVIHRDIKVENFLMDKDLNLKIIDFGLSNMLSSDGVLRTQCGSPAYAAPEIFSNATYGPAVDVWSIGVNMYAMLTGELPFKVEPPSSISKLHSCILQGCRIPHTLTKDCKDLLGKMLTLSETSRITLREIMKHPWMNRGYSSLLYPTKYPVKYDDIDKSVVSKMAEHGYDPENVVAMVTQNKPVAANDDHRSVLSAETNSSTLRSCVITENSKWKSVRTALLKERPTRGRYYREEVDRSKRLRDVAFARNVSKLSNDPMSSYRKTPTREKVMEDMTKHMNVLSQKNGLNNVENVSRSKAPVRMCYIQYDTWLHQRNSEPEARRKHLLLQKAGKKGILAKTDIVVVDNMSSDVERESSSPHLKSGETEDSLAGKGNLNETFDVNNLVQTGNPESTVDKIAVDNSNDESASDVTVPQESIVTSRSVSEIEKTERGSHVSADKSLDTIEGESDDVTTARNESDYNLNCRQDRGGGIPRGSWTPIETVSKSNQNESYHFNAKELMRTSRCIIIVNGREEDFSYDNYKFKGRRQNNATAVTTQHRRPKTEPDVDTSRKDYYKVQPLGVYYNFRTRIRLVRSQPHLGHH